MQRKVYIFFAVYLIATALMAWLAFMLGHNRGLNAAGLPPTPASEDRAAFVDITENTWSCDQFRGFPGLRANHRERVCGPGARRFAAASARRGQRARPLEEAVILKLAGGEPFVRTGLDGHRPAGQQEGGLSAFDAPAQPLGGLLAEAGGAGGWRPPPGGGFFTQPPVLLGGALTNAAGPTGPGPAGPGPGQTPTAPPPSDGPPPDVVPAPLPGALPLMGTALAGLFGARAARRRRARR